jgi:hypothetical protein
LKRIFKKIKKLKKENFYMKKTVMKILREEYGVRHIDGRHLSNYKFSTLCAYIDQLNKERDEENNKEE